MDARDDLPGIPAPPPVGETALRPGTFDGTCVVVTGGGTGLGKAIATEFARLGADVVVASRKDEHLDAGRQAAFLELLLEQCAQAGSSLLFVSHDMRLAGAFARTLALDEINRAHAAESGS